MQEWSIFMKALDCYSSALRERPVSLDPKARPVAYVSEDDENMWNSLLISSCIHHIILSLFSLLGRIRFTSTSLDKGLNYVFGWAMISKLMISCREHEIISLLVLDLKALCCRTQYSVILTVLANEK